jgi:hypothetical protein
MLKHNSILPILSLLSCLSTPALAETYLPENDPCGELHLVGGDIATIYNNSNYQWNVVFTTRAENDQYLVRINAGAVKYLNNGWWVDGGEGDYTNSKTYRIPVPPNSNVDIAYCASGSDTLGFGIIQGSVAFETLIAYVPGYNTPGHGLPVNGVQFGGVYDGFSPTPKPQFFNNGTTAHVDYNRKPGGVNLEYGSLTICPNDPWCMTP